MQADSGGKDGSPDQLTPQARQTTSAVDFGILFGLLQTYPSTECERTVFGFIAKSALLF